METLAINPKIDCGPKPELIALFAEHFCIKEEDAHSPEFFKTWGKPRLLWNVRSETFTESEARRQRAAMGEEAWQHLYWDTAATDGRIIVFAMRCKGAPESERLTGGVPHDLYCTCLSIDERLEAPAEYERETPVPPPAKSYVWLLGRVISETYLAKIRLLPNARFCGPDDSTRNNPFYFRFDGGVGAVMPCLIDPDSEGAD